MKYAGGNRQGEGQRCGRGRGRERRSEIGEEQEEVGRGRGRARGRGRRIGRISNPSTLPGQPMNEAIDVPPPSLPFTRSSNSTITLPATPTEFFYHFIDEDPLNLALDETNRQVYKSNPYTSNTQNICFT